MGYRFRIWFSGLCHFVQNRDPNARCSLCVVLPNASVDARFRNHVPAIHLVEREQDDCGKLRIVKGEELLRLDRDPDGLPDRRRVAFELTRADNIVTLEPLEAVRDALLWMGDIAGGYADENAEIVSADPPHSVTAQILLESPRVEYDPNLSVVREWMVPGTLTGERKAVKVADPVFVEFSDIRSARLISSSIDNPRADPVGFPLSAVGETIEIFIANRCDEDCEDDPGLVELRWENEYCVSWVQIDKDFEYNFHMLHPSTLAAIDRLLPRDANSNAKYPLPESPLLTLKVAPHLCLEVRENAEFEEVLELLREAVNKGTGSGSGHDCLGSQGLARFVDLDQFLPEPQPVVPALLGKSKAPARGVASPVLERAAAGLSPKESPTSAVKKPKLLRAEPRK